MKNKNRVSEETRDMPNDNQHVPQIRFPEFNDKYRVLKLKDVVNFFKGKNISKKDISNKGIPCIRYGELYTKYNEIIDEVYSKTNLNKNDLIFSKKNDIIIPSSGETAIDISTASCILKDNIAISADITILRTKENGPYLAYYLNYKKQDIAKLAQGASIIHLYSNELKKLKIIIPSIKEQEKIVYFIYLIDKKIKLLEKKQNLLINKKRKIIYDLILNVKNKYSEINLSKIFDFKKGKGLSKERVSSKGKYPAILYGELYTTYNELPKKIVSYTDYDEGILSKKGDLLIPASTTTSGIDLINITIINSDNIRLGGDINILRNKNKIDIDPLFIGIFIEYGLTKEILRLTQGSTIIHLYGKFLKQLNINLPPFKIQKTISELFKNYLKKEKILEIKIKTLKKYKKGLLQKMFV